MGAVDVSIYLDDIEALAQELASYGTVTMTMQRRRAADSVFSEVDDLIARPEIKAIKIEVQSEPPNLFAWLEIALIGGIHAYSSQRNWDAVRVLEHFISSADRRKRLLWQRILLGRPLSDVDLVLARRVSAAESQERYRRDLRLALTSGVVGAVLGATATLLAAWIQSN